MGEEGVATVPSARASEVSDTRVDVAIPTYGKPTYLAEAIESVLAQTFTAWRLTVSDNGPGGGEAAAVVARYRDDPRVGYAVTGGVPMHENWTRCIQTGQAPYVTVLADDERWQPGFLTRHVGFLDAHPTCGLVFSRPGAIDDRGRPLAPRAHRVGEGLHQPIEFVPRLFEAQLIHSPPILVRRRAYEAVGPAFSDHPELMDYEMWLRIAVSFPVGYLAVTESEGRFHGTNVSSMATALGEARLRFLDQAEALIRRELPELELPVRLRERRRARFLVTCALDALEQGRRGPAAGYLRASLRVYPLSVLDPRLAGALVTLHGGPPARDVLARARRLQRRSHRLRILYGEGKLAFHRLLHAISRSTSSSLRSRLTPVSRRASQIRFFRR